MWGEELKSPCLLFQQGQTMVAHLWQAMSNNCDMVSRILPTRGYREVPRFYPRIADTHEERLFR